MEQSEPVQLWRDLTDVPAGFGPSAVTIGNFDGVHRGHLTVLNLVVHTARADDLRSVAITFDPHPLAVLHPERTPQPLSTVEHKIDLLAAAGLDAVLVMPFTLELAQWSPRRFVQEVLVDALGAKAVVVGQDTRFGQGNSGDVNTLRELGAELGFSVHVVAELGPHGPHARVGGEPEERRWSSTWVREMIAAGEAGAAAQALGRPHRITGLVVHGDHRGRELGFPTANLDTSSIGALPADGVYAGWLIRDRGRGDRLPAAVSVGTNPTFDGTIRRVESYVLDRDDLDLYGEVVAVEFVERLRPTLRFDGIEPLIHQMNDDVARTRDVLGVREPA